VTPGEVPALLEAIQARVARAAPDMAEAMGRTHAKYMTDVTLAGAGAHGGATVGHYPVAAAPGRPPMSMTGNLRRNIVVVPGGGGPGEATSIVGPTVAYACALEFGGVHTGDMWLWKRYVGAGGVLESGWRKRKVELQAHPFVWPSRQAVIANGSVTAAANAVFMKEVWGA
jgi:hypothetical protein